MAIKKTTQQVANELLEKHNLTLTSEYLSAHSKISFLCPNGHENEGAATNIIQRGYKCKQCIHGRTIIPKINWTDAEVIKLKTLVAKVLQTEEIAKELNTTVSAINNACEKFNISKPKAAHTEVKLQDVLSDQGRTLVSTFNGTRALITIQCEKGHVITQQAGNVIYKDTGCPACFSADGVSKTEKELRAFIEDNYNGWIIYNDRTLLDGKEVDILLPDINLAIELNGTYWHQESKVGKNYHLNKTNQLEQEGFQLLHIYDYFWTHHKEIVKSRILSKLKSTIKIPARKTVVKEITANEAKIFLSNNHIQGYTASSTHLGLLHQNELVAVMTFSKPRFTKDYDYELTRFATKLNTTVQGGASKLFKRRPVGSIISYADRSYSNGNLYKQLGFKFSHATEPGYAYYNRHDRLSRYQCQKHKIDPKSPLTEKELMAERNFYPVYDSGNLVFTHENPSACLKDDHS